MMKTIKVMNMAILCMALTLGACSDGEDGADGLPGADGAQGPAGAAGADGVSCWDLNANGTGDAEEDVNNDGNFDALDCQGEQGEAGADGNANVFRTDVLINEFSDTQLIYNLTTNFVTLEDIPNYAWFFYLENDTSIFYPVPGPLEANQQYTRYYISGANLFITFYNTADDSSYNVPAGDYVELRIIAIEAPIQSPGKNASQSIMAELKAAGVDTGDYHAMVDYFGL